MQWARLITDVPSDLRRGAWYKVVRTSPQDVTVDIRGKHVEIDRNAVEVVAEPPPRWTVVPSPKNAPRYPTSWGPKYAVCPNCRNRARIQGHPTSLRCDRCNGLFDIAWDDSYLTPA